MFHTGIGIAFETICQLIEMATVELKNSKNNLFDATDIHAKIAAQEELDGNMRVVLYLFVIAAKVALAPFCVRT